jgi:hypothetical protein
MPISAPTLRLNYRMASQGDRILLSIWEESVVSENRLKPFLFKARYLVDSQEEATEILQQYQETYRSSIPAWSRHY